ncbi:MAG TPA: OmpA family protein [Cyclobacteriaceae bacterium]|nr:OmpA family protein [Cyclobacteriaceae bacterium]
MNKLVMKKANKKFNRGEYEVSIDLYHKALKRTAVAGEANFYIGESYRLSNRLKKALPYYQAAIKNNYDEDIAKYYLAQSLKVNEKYDDAMKIIDDLSQHAHDEEVKKLVAIELNNLEELSRLLNSKNYFRVKNLTEINTPEAEYAPVYNNGDLFFTSSRNSNKIYKATGTGYTRIFQVKTTGARVDLSTLKSLDAVINDENANEGSVTFSSDGRTMIFAKGNTGKRRGAKDVDLFITSYRRGGWTPPRILTISDPSAWDSSPSLSSDGRTLYFSSNRNGGFGGTDIYSSTRDGRGRWGNLRNLGPEINTPGNEMFPYSADDGTLYFSSDGHPGFGNLDLFKAERREGKLVARNLGSPINSSSDDFGLYLFSPTKGFFTSNRDGGSGDDDIYTFVNDDPDLKIVNYYLTGITVTYDDDGNETTLGGSTVKLLDEANQLISEFLTGQDGKFSFRVYPEENYNITGQKSDFLTTRVPFSTIGKSIPPDSLTKLITDHYFQIKVPLDKIVIDKAIVLENIYYDLDEWYIRPDAALELDKLVAILNDNPEIKIELSSHTDSRATADYNLELSKKRALAAVEYIISKGIGPDRIIAKGYGESQLIISDEYISRQATEVEKESAHQKNRRTEFKILEYTKIDEELADQEEDDGTGGETVWEKEIEWDQ